MKNACSHIVYYLTATTPLCSENNMRKLVIKSPICFEPSPKSPVAASFTSCHCRPTHYLHGPSCCVYTSLQDYMCAPLLSDGEDIPFSFLILLSALIDVPRWPFFFFFFFSELYTKVKIKSWWGFHIYIFHCNGNCIFCVLKLADFKCWKLKKQNISFQLGNSGNGVRLYFSGLQNHYRWWLQPWN